MRISPAQFAAWSLLTCGALSDLFGNRAASAAIQYSLILAMLAAPALLLLLILAWLAGRSRD